MGEFVECVNGISEASKYLNFPVVSGNVSFYNETKDKGIKPTPSIGGVGLLENYKKMISMDLKNEKNVVLVIGKTVGHIEQSIFARTILLEKKGPPPEINLFNEKNNGETVLKLMKHNLIMSCHDISVGGILIAIAKMCIKGNKGIVINSPKGLVNKFNYFFGEDQGRYLIEINASNLKNVENLLKENSVHYDILGIVDKNQLKLNDEFDIDIKVLKDCYINWLKNYMVN